MQISPITTHWVHRYLVEPYLQGCRLCNLAWLGVDFEHLNRPTISLKNRMIHWMQGVSLLVPFVNVIIWTFWQAFGHPPSIRDPFNPQVSSLSTRIVIPQAPPAPGPPQQIANPPLFSLPETDPVERIRDVGEISSDSHSATSDRSYMEINSDGVPTVSRWQIDKQEENQMVEEDCSFYHCLSIYKNNSLSEAHYQIRDLRFDIWIQSPNQVKVLLNDNESTFLLEKETPVYQQPQLSLQPFVLSEQNQTEFYSISPINPVQTFIDLGQSPPLLIKFTAKKLGLEEGEGGEKLLKIQLSFDHQLLNHIGRIYFWFDPTTAEMKQYHYSSVFGTFGKWKKGALQTP